VIDIYVPVVEESDRTMNTQLEAPAIVHGDRVRLIQILANIIKNALQHTPEGTDLRLISRPEELSLADSGPRISTDQRDFIAQPRKRTQSVYSGGLCQKSRHYKSVRLLSEPCQHDAPYSLHRVKHH
jgi:signal transduction histidine kinase